jgi:hypothetical protein
LTSSSLENSRQFILVRGVEPATTGRDPDVLPDTLSTRQIDDLEDRRYAAMVDADLDVLDGLSSDDVIAPTPSSAAPGWRSSGTMSGSVHMKSAGEALNSRVAAVWVAEADAVRWRSSPRPSRVTTDVGPCARRRH